MKDVKNYPNIFVHGMLGWGEKEKIYNILPYWGMFCGSLTDKLSKKGYESYAVKVGSLNSAWDRACELYAQLMGTTVDYGKAHSNKYGHNRFGRNFKNPLIKNWGKENTDGDLNKINLLGHSFGGSTIRMFVELLTNGSQEEKDATSEKDISPLFKGKHGNWVHSVTTISSPHEGTTIFYALPKIMKFAEYFSFGIANIFGNTKVNRGYDWVLEQFGLSSVPESKPYYGNMFNIAGIKKALDSKDHLWYDLTLHGAKELNKKITCCDNTYYFSISGQMTDKDISTGHHLHCKGMSLLLWPTAHLMGKYSKNTVNDILIDETWCANDGCLSTISSLHPFNEPYIKFDDIIDEKLKKGIWYVMPIKHVDHSKIIGGSLQYIGKSKEFVNYYLKHIEMLSTLD